ncbi:hypothetical protein B0H16DRAFT_1226242, partial [Mycena metata]
LDELADGLDVLRILERAYERTLGAHVVTVPVSDGLPMNGEAGQAPIPTTPMRTQGASTGESLSSTSTSVPRARPWTTTTAEGERETSTSLPSRSPLSGERNAGPKTIPLLAGSSTALVAVLDYVPRGEVEGGGGGAKATEDEDESELTPVLKIAHVGDCMGMLVREGAVRWRSEEMWWRWNTPVQLITPSSAAHLFTLPVRAGDIVILASDGLSDNLWDEDVLEEVGRVGRAWAGSDSGSASSSDTAVAGVDSARLRRRTLAGMLSEALCSRARRVATRRAGREGGRRCDEDDTPFARRARETGKVYRGGKNDDISVIVAVIAPAEE